MHDRKLGLEVASVVDLNNGIHPGLHPLLKFKLGTDLCLPGEVGLWREHSPSGVSAVC